MKINIFLIATFLLSCFSTFAQPLNKATYSTMISLAEEQLEKKDYYRALEWYEKAYEESKDRELSIIIADMHYMLRDYRKAERAYSRALRRDKKDALVEKRFEYARSLKMNEKYQEAIDEFDNFIAKTTDPARKELAEIEKAGAEFGLVAKPVDGLSVSNAGKEVNNKYSEYSPFLGIGGNEMYYTAFPDDELIVVDEEKTDYQTKIMTAKKGDKGWGSPQALDERINRPGYFNSNVSISPDGNRMFFNRQLLDGNTLIESKIYMSMKGGDGWGAANEVEAVNGDFIAKSPSVGELFGNEVLFFVSDKEGEGHGGYDIYYVTHKGDGNYGDAVNLGPKINTVGDEDTPFYRDGMLYFSSTGHPGLGGYDIFQTSWDGSRWSEPTNMGKGYNSPVDDLYFMLDKEGYTGLLASNRISQGARSVKSKTCCNDIYNVSLKKIDVDLIALAFDSLTQEQLSNVSFEIVEVVDNTPKPVGSSTTKEFKQVLELDKFYRITATAENYESATLEFNSVGLLDSRTFNEKLYLKPLPKYRVLTSEEPFVLQNIYYDFDDDKILSPAEPDLRFILELMSEYPKMEIEMSSHTDFRGKDGYNRDLSQRRAESARRWLLANSEIIRRRIVAKGYGESVPKTIDSTLAKQHSFMKEGDVLTEAYIEALATDSLKEIAHQINRRTEFKITAGPKSIRISEERLIQIGNRKVQEEIKSSPDKQRLIQQNDPIKIHQFSSLYGKKNLKGLPIMQFKNRTKHLGKIKKGDKREFSFEYENVGDVELIIDLIQACECTTTDYTPKRVKPGEKGTIKAVFDSTEKDENETIDIDIYLQNIEPDTEIPIIERLQYTYELEK